MELYKIRITGKVQGVYYRKFVSQAAMKGGYKGSIQNMPDGSVEVIVELTDDELESFMKILYEGSLSSVVEAISYDIIQESPLVFDGFVILK
jgi:acylphosphatase